MGALRPPKHVEASSETLGHEAPVSETAVRAFDPARGRHWALGRLGRVGEPLIAVVAVAAAAWLVFGGVYPNFDTAYAIVWGDSVLGGALPDYLAPTAPTPHPLATAAGALASLFGTGAFTLMAALAFASLGGLVYAVYRLGRECHSPAVGVLAALVVGTSFSVLSRTTAAYLDLTAVALILVAAVLEVRRPRRGTAVLALLALAGLQRPEVWLLTAVYWVYLARPLDWPDRVRMGALAAIAPLLWALTDLIVTGNPLHSVNGTRVAAADDAASTGLDTSGAVLPVPLAAVGLVAVGLALALLLRRRPRLPRPWLIAAALALVGAIVLASASHGPWATETAVEALRKVLRLPVIAGSLLGIVLAASSAPRRWAVPAACLALGMLAFLALGVMGLPLDDRFLYLPATVLALCFSLLAVGWLDRRGSGDAGSPAWLGRAWPLAGAVVLVGFALSLPAQVKRIQDLRGAVSLRMEAISDLRALADDARGGAVLKSCSPVTFPNEQAVPFVAYMAGRSLDSLRSAEASSPRRGAYLVPRRHLVEAHAFLLSPASGRVGALQAPRGFSTVASNRSWVLQAKGCAAAGTR